ncbi:hypothetical protein POTOM_006732 [Populus tomentosa]|uniref:GAG-pre-integrase domain-containing protein n=1 Tax=Populus tomentosa TaxID=118781 RepID=A0A8X8ANQ5_POPTO|nr:hypothetical protein POTOM_006732 [Populus tomentosa]
MGDNHVVEISGIGTIKLKMYDGLIRTISGVRHVKDLKKNLLSVGQFDSLGCKIRTDNGIMKIVKGALVVLKARKTVANMFVLMGETYQGAEASIASASPAEEKTMMWHQKLGHMSEKGLKVLSDQKLLPGLTKVTLPFYKMQMEENNSILKETTEVQIENTQNHTSSKAVPEHEEQEQIESETPEVRRSTRERRPPAWHSEYVTESNIAYSHGGSGGQTALHAAVMETHSDHKAAERLLEFDTCNAFWRASGPKWQECSSFFHSSRKASVVRGVLEIAELQWPINQADNGSKSQK